MLFSLLVHTIKQLYSGCLLLDCDYDRSSRHPMNGTETVLTSRRQIGTSQREPERLQKRCGGNVSFLCMFDNSWLTIGRSQLARDLEILSPATFRQTATQPLALLSIPQDGGRIYTSENLKPFEPCLLEFARVEEHGDLLIVFLRCATVCAPSSSACLLSPAQRLSCLVHLRDCSAAQLDRLSVCTLWQTAFASKLAATYPALIAFV